MSNPLNVPGERLPRLRIGHIVPAIQIGGLLRELELTEQLPNDAFQSIIISIFDLDDAGALSSLAGPVVRLKIPISAYKEEARICAALVTQFRIHQIDLVHSYHCFSDFYGIPASHLLGVAFVRSVLGVTQANWSAPLDRTEVLDDWSKDVIEKELSLESSVCCTLVVSKDLKSRLVAHGFSPGKIEVSYPGVDLDAMLGRSFICTSPRDRNTIGFFHRIEPVKRPLDLLALIPLLHERDLRPLVLYPRMGSMLADFERAIISAGLTDDFEAFDSSANLWQVVARPDLLLITSHSEGVPRVMLEAMARRVPVAATSVGGIPEVIEDGVSGYMFNPGDLKSGALIVARILRSSSERQRLAQAAESVVIRGFGRKRQVMDLQHAYVRAIRNRSPQNQQTDP